MKKRKDNKIKILESNLDESISITATEELDKEKEKL
jgi:hypothetical protein